MFISIIFIIILSFVLFEFTNINIYIISTIFILLLFSLFFFSYKNYSFIITSNTDFSDKDISFIKSINPHNTISHTLFHDNKLIIHIKSYNISQFTNSILQKYYSITPINTLFYLKQLSSILSNNKHFNQQQIYDLNLNCIINKNYLNDQQLLLSNHITHQQFKLANIYVIIISISFNAKIIF